MMGELGGPLASDVIGRVLQRQVDLVESGGAWVLKILPDTSDDGAGSVCIWESSFEGEPIDEIGWMILPEFQGRGLATAAVGAIFDRARLEGRWDVIHAFPGVANGPSNAICRKMGFAQVEEADVEYAERLLRCNHWRMTLSA